MLTPHGADNFGTDPSFQEFSQVITRGRQRIHKTAWRSSLGNRSNSVLWVDGIFETQFRSLAFSPLTTAEWTAFSKWNIVIGRRIRASRKSRPPVARRHREAREQASPSSLQFSSGNNNTTTKTNVFVVCVSVLFWAKIVYEKWWAAMTSTSDKNTRQRLPLRNGFSRGLSLLICVWKSE